MVDAPANCKALFALHAPLFALSKKLMPEELIIHGGILKTGSSALQVFFAQNRDRLLQQSLDYLPISGIKAAAEGKITMGNGWGVAGSVSPPGPNSPPSPERELRRLFEALDASTASRALISSEIFTTVKPSLMAELVDQLRAKGLRVRIVYFIRRQDRYLAALYMQLTKIAGLAEMPETWFSNARRPPYLKYHKFYRQWCAILGRENVSCHIYDKAIERENGLMVTFLDEFGIDARHFEFPGTVNNGLSKSELLVLLALNRLKPRPRFSDWLVKNSSRRDASGIGQDYDLIPSDIAEEIKDFYREENDRLAREYFGRPTLFEWDIEHSATAGLAGVSLSLDDVVSVIGGITVRLDERLFAIESSLQKMQLIEARIQRLLRGELRGRVDAPRENALPTPKKDRAFTPAAQDAAG